MIGEDEPISQLFLPPLGIDKGRGQTKKKRKAENGKTNEGENKSRE